MRTMNDTDDRPRDLLRGFAPLAVAVVLAVLVVLLVPSVAPERIVSVPADGPAATSSSTTATTAAPLPAETTVAP